MKYKETPFNFSGVYAPYLEAYSEYKRSLGYKVGPSTIYILREIDSLAEKFSITANELIMTKEVVDFYVAKRHEQEALQTQHRRMVLIRQFALYMNRLGYDFYVFPETEIVKQNTDFVPYIFTHDEVERLIRVLDQIEPCKISPQYHLIYPMLFRMLYGCGLRINEALALKIDDVDTSSGIIKITDSKNGEQRLLPMRESLRLYCILYKKRMGLGLNGTHFYYPSPRGGEYFSAPVYCQFRKLMAKAGIYRENGTTPRVHDIRHTFAVHSLEKMVAEGRDIYCALPYLSTYLGHRDIKSTEKYLRLTKEAFESVLLQMDQYYEDVFPEVPGDEV